MCKLFITGPTGVTAATMGSPIGFPYRFDFLSQYNEITGLTKKEEILMGLPKDFVSKGNEHMIVIRVNENRRVIIKSVSTSLSYYLQKSGVNNAWDDVSAFSSLDEIELYLMREKLFHEDTEFSSIKDAKGFLEVKKKKD